MLEVPFIVRNDTLIRVTGAFADDSSLFDDVNSNTCSDEAIDAINWAAKNGIVNGRGNRIFDPNGSATRAEFVTMMHRYAANEAAASTDTAFTDIATHWANAHIVWAENHDPFLTNGLTETTFGPDVTITRAQTLTIMHRYANKPSVTGSNPFTDATAGWYQDAIIWGVDQKITNGTSATTFAPNQDVKRKEIALFLYRAANAGALEAAPADDTTTDDTSSETTTE